MKLMELFRRRATESAARRWGRWNAKGMLVSFLAMQEHYKGSAPTYAWLARKVMLARSHWEQVGEISFVFAKSGEQIQISDDMSLLRVMHMVVDVEYGHELRQMVCPRGNRLSSFGWHMPRQIAAYRAEEEGLSSSSKVAHLRPLFDSNAFPSGGQCSGSVHSFCVQLLQRPHIDLSALQRSDAFGGSAGGG